MSKTPYELRVELLKLANEICITPIFQKREALMQEYHSRLGLNETVQFPALPDFPTTETIIAQAERLNKFVSQS
jgi:hypothetical protein